jgi:tripartite-type tricarboxylate transporter receptor subunit TctC
MKGHRRIALAAVMLLAAAPAAVHPAAAQDFYKGKVLNIVVGFTPGGGFDLNARLLSRYIGRYIPGNPDVVVNNMPGAGSITSVRHLQAIAPKDGTVISTFNFGLIGESKITPDKVPLDFRKFAWIGSISQDLTVCYVWHTLGVKTMADLKTHKNIHFGLTTVGASEDINTRILKNVFGIDIKQVSGYPGSAEERLAIQRGELEGGCGAWSSIPEDWVKNNLFNAVYRSAPTLAPDMPQDVPYAVDMAPDERAKAIIRLLVTPGDVGRPFIAAVAVPADRIKILRDAFNASVKDPKFVAEATKLRLPVSPKTGEEAVKTVEAIYATPDDVVAAARKVTGG